MANNWKRALKTKCGCCGGFVGYRTKEKIKEQYKLSQCIQDSFPNVTGLGDNRDNALEQSTISGIIIAFTRLYAMEAVLRSVFTFTEMSITKTEDVDDVIV